MFKKNKIMPLIWIFIILLLFVFVVREQSNMRVYSMYVAGNSGSISLYNKDFKKVKGVVRGTKVKTNKLVVKKNKDKYFKIVYDKKNYYIKEENLVERKRDILFEHEVYVRTNATIYKNNSGIEILSYVKKGEKLEILGFDKILSDGSVNKYKVKYNDIKGYVYSKYTSLTLEDALKVYSENGIQDYMKKMGDSLGAGSAIDLDYYPYEKGSFKNNVMPDDVRALYINASAISNIDSYIALARESGINAFVIDIKDNTAPAYPAEAMKKYSKTNYDHAINTYENYKKYVKKAEDAGFYLIGRITTFKDSYYIDDHKEAAIKNSGGDAFNHNGSYWPSAYNRGVWEFNVALALESVKELGFNEIQFDYVRFPDRTTKLEREGVINLSNTYNETKSQALQTFIMYACDELHEQGAYCSIDVFGESASNYVTAYGQFWPAISNVADVISGMPYPDHFNAHEYGIDEVVWTVPYKLLNEWSKYVVKKQSVIPTPAKVRTWIQVYDTHKTPSVVYDTSKVSDEIRALYDNKLNAGFMTWSGSSSISKYKSVKDAFKGEY